MRRETRFPYWLVERWFYWSCWGMARYRDTDAAPIATRRGAFRSAVACAYRNRHPRYRCASCDWVHDGLAVAKAHAESRDHWVFDTTKRFGEPGRVITHGRVT